MKPGTARGGADRAIDVLIWLPTPLPEVKQPARPVRGR